MAPPSCDTAIRKVRTAGDTLARSRVVASCISKVVHVRVSNIYTSLGAEPTKSEAEVYAWSTRVPDLMVYPRHSLRAMPPSASSSIRTSTYWSSATDTRQYMLCCGQQMAYRERVSVAHQHPTIPPRRRAHSHITPDPHICTRTYRCLQILTFCLSCGGVSTYVSEPPLKCFVGSYLARVSDQHFTFSTRFPVRKVLAHLCSTTSTATAKFKSQGNASPLPRSFSPFTPTQ